MAQASMDPSALQTMITPLSKASDAMLMTLSGMLAYMIPLFFAQGDFPSGRETCARL